MIHPQSVKCLGAGVGCFWTGGGLSFKKKKRWIRQNSGIEPFEQELEGSGQCSSGDLVFPQHLRTRLQLRQRWDPDFLVCIYLMASPFLLLLAG